MKRRDLVRHLQEHGCVLKRESGNHSVVYEPGPENCFGSAALYRNKSPDGAKNLSRSGNSRAGKR